jgi:hypothetical protein
VPTCYIEQTIDEVTQDIVAATDISCAIAQTIDEIAQDAVGGLVVLCAISQDLPEIGEQAGDLIAYGMTIAVSAVHSERVEKNVIAITTVLCEAMTAGVMGKVVTT